MRNQITPTMNAFLDEIIAAYSEKYRDSINRQALYENVLLRWGETGSARYEVSDFDSIDGTTWCLSSDDAFDEYHASIAEDEE